MTRIPSLSHSIRSIKARVHRGECPRTKEFSVPHADISKDPKTKKPKVDPWFRCPDADGHCS